MKLAELQCLSCPAQWKQVPGPAPCPACGALYTKWTNYERDFVKGNKDGRQEAGDVSAD